MRSAWVVVVGLLVLLLGCTQEDPRAPQAPSAAPATPRTSVVIDPEVFAYDDERGYSYETLLVTWTDPDVQPARVVRSLRRTGTRFLRVDERGIEHPDADSALRAYEEGFYTPNYVSDPDPQERGVQMYVDCKGVIPERMETTFRRILFEELELLGHDLRVVPAVYE